MWIIGAILLWFIRSYYFVIDGVAAIALVLRIRLRQQRKLAFPANLSHFAIRCNDLCVLDQATLVRLVEAVRAAGHVRYLTIIAGDSGFEREIHTEMQDVSFYYNYDRIFTPPKAEILSVNIVDGDPRELHVLKLKEEVVFDNAGFPPIDLYLTMNHTLTFAHSSPLLLGFTHFL